MKIIIQKIPERIRVRLGRIATNKTTQKQYEEVTSPPSHHEEDGVEGYPKQRGSRDGGWRGAQPIQRV